MRGTSLVVFLLISLVITRAAVPSDEITNLPGWDAPLPSRHYSGFLHLPGGHHMHYWFVESEGPDPREAPVLLWFNGGPGASSLYGSFVELGPFKMTDDSFDGGNGSVPKLFHNEFGWQKLANILFFESPCGVGFSYCDGGCPVWNDSSAANDNYLAVQMFFSLYPEYAKNDFFIAGESYAGIYVPMLVDLIQNDPKSTLNLKGFAVGDGCTGFNSLGSCGLNAAENLVNFLWGHSQFPTATYHKIFQVCGNSLRYNNFTNIPACKSLLDELSNTVVGYNPYSLYDECYQTGDTVSKAGENIFLRKMPAQFPPPDSPQDTYKCGGNRGLNAYLNNKLVQDAIHMPHITWFQRDGWDEGYKSTEPDLTQKYLQFIKKYRVLIYSGDTDPGVPWLGTELWTSSLNLPVAEAWRAWTIDGATQVGGFIVRYHTNFDFLTIRGAGHMVPLFKPRHAYEFISEFLSNGNYKPYVPAPPPPNFMG
eukprot:TRINITY_DN31722_c0_g1_i1.p1 TRINITY_DN31722_c0_g1~~TRINITY_DN31722_c0_g1_i1.p1  ORF type:complete len:479 (+),score=41.74 TRINITY_DN31722_c0_g1_i1:44-1480(+)